MKRLLLLDQFGHTGGGQAVLRDLATAAVDSGVETHLASPPGPAADALQDSGVVIHSLPLPSLSSHRKGANDAARYAASYPRTWATVERLARKVDPDLVHANGGRVLAQAALAPRCRPLSFHAHSAYDDAPSRWLARRSLSLVRRPLAVAPSPFMQRWTVGNLGLEPRQVALIWNWVDDRLFATSSATKGATTPKRIVVLGRITPLKGQLTALRAFKRLPSAVRTRVRLEILGPVDRSAGGDDYALQLTSESAGDDDVICRFEYVDALAAFEGAHVCLVPSQVDETFGLVAAEAMAAGVPVIVSERGALPDVIGDAGIRVPPGDVAALSSALAGLLSDEVQRRTVADAGRERAKLLFRRERQVNALLGVLDDHSRRAR